MFKMGRIARRVFAAGCVTALCALAACGIATGCTSSPAADDSAKEPAAEQPAAKPLEGKVIKVYCGAGMTDPFQEIADAFTAETGCEVEVTYANAAQIQTQINTTQEGDFFIAGSAEELKPVSESVASSTDLVKHIPVLIVAAGNPQGIAGLADLASAERVLVGDPESTPIGKIAKKALTDAGLWEQLSASGAITTTTTAPQIAAALANGEGDAGIVWKENVKGDGAEIVATSDLDALVKTVPAARLSFSADAQAADAFSEFLQTDTAWEIWADYGYERV